MSTPATQRRIPDKIKRLPLQDVGLNNLVAVPYVVTLSEPLHTGLRLAAKEVEIIPVQCGFSKPFTINGITATTYEFMYGKKPSHLIASAISAL